MSKFYTNVMVHGNRIIETGYENGERFFRKHKYKPTIGIETNKETKWKTLKGNRFLEEKQFPDIASYNEYRLAYGQTIPLHGVISPMYQFIYDNYLDMEFDTSQIKTLMFDIEAVSEKEFPKPEYADYPINSITIKDRNKQIFYVLSTKDFDKTKSITVDPEKIRFRKFSTEEGMLLAVISIVEKVRPDIIIGYYSNGFDFPYLLNRMFTILPEEQVNRLSPVKRVSIKEREYKGKTEFKFDIKGVALLDFLELYKKFTYVTREEYSLDFISETELGENKLKFDDVADNLYDLWQEDSQLFIDYNIYDVELIDLLDKKLGLIDLIINVAYMGNVNFLDAMSPVKLWHGILYRELKNDNIMFPPFISHEKTPYAGAYVKDPIIKKYGLMASFDLNSLYPSLMQQFNISPETIYDDEHINVSLSQIDEKFFDDEFIKKNTKKNKILSGNGHYFEKNKIGIFPRMMEKFGIMRRKEKNSMLEAEQDLEYIKEEIKKRKL